MKTSILLLVLALFAVSFTNGEEAKPKITIDVYSADKPNPVRPNGEFDSEPLDLYLDGKFIGTTPLILTERDLKRLKLPAYEQVDISPTEHWNTWDLSKEGGFVISHREARNEKRYLTFKSRNKTNPMTKYSKGLIRNAPGDGTVKFYAKFPISKEA
jgi:hypothetical protein